METHGGDSYRSGRALRRSNRARRQLLLSDDNDDSGGIVPDNNNIDTNVWYALPEWHSSRRMLRAPRHNEGFYTELQNIEETEVNENRSSSLTTRSEQRSDRTPSPSLLSSPSPSRHRHTSLPIRRRRDRRTVNPSYREHEHMQRRYNRFRFEYEPSPNYSPVARSVENQQEQQQVALDNGYVAAASSDVAEEVDDDYITPLENNNDHREQNANLEDNGVVPSSQDDLSSTSLSLPTSSTVLVAAPGLSTADAQACSNDIHFSRSIETLEKICHQAEQDHNDETLNAWLDVEVQRFLDDNNIDTESVEITFEELKGEILPVEEYHRRIAQANPMIEIGQSSLMNDTIDRLEHICQRHVPAFDRLQLLKMDYLLKRYREVQKESSDIIENTSKSLVALCRAKNDYLQQKRIMQNVDMKRISILNLLCRTVNDVIVDKQANQSSFTTPDPLAVFAEMQKRCDICYETKRVFDFAFSMKCSHCYCRVCLSNHYRDINPLADSARYRFIPEKPCMICRVPVSSYMILQRVGELYKHTILNFLSGILYL